MEKKINQIEQQIRNKCSKELKDKAIEVVSLLIDLDKKLTNNVHNVHPVVPQKLTFCVFERKYIYDNNSDIKEEKAIHIFHDLFEQKYLDMMVKSEVAKMLKKIELFE